MDPGVGFGIFLVCCYYRLMKGLKKVIPNDKKETNILEQKCYMVLIFKNIM